eukprot:1939201-Rhodomonas_salina.2
MACLCLESAGFAMPGEGTSFAQVGANFTPSPQLAMSGPDSVCGCPRTGICLFAGCSRSRPLAG